MRKRPGRLANADCAQGAGNLPAADAGDNAGWVSGGEIAMDRMRKRGAFQRPLCMSFVSEPLSVSISKL